MSHPKQQTSNNDQISVTEYRELFISPSVSAPRATSRFQHIIRHRALLSTASHPNSSLTFPFPSNKESAFPFPSFLFPLQSSISPAPAPPSSIPSIDTNPAIQHRPSPRQHFCPYPTPPTPPPFRIPSLSISLCPLKHVTPAKGGCLYNLFLTLHSSICES